MTALSRALGLLLYLLTSTKAFAATSSSGKSPIEKHGSKDAETDRIMRLPMRRRKPSKQQGATLNALQAPLQRDPLQESTSTSSSTFASPTVATVNISGIFKEMAYTIDLWIGEPAQRVGLDFDTGSSETWVSPHCTMNGWNPAYETLCRQLGMYLPQQSDTVANASYTQPARYISYGSGEAHVQFFKDKVSFTEPAYYDTVMFQLQKPVLFGVATWSTGMISGIFGAAYGQGYNQNYSNFIDAMYDQKLIRDKDFSFALGSVDDNNGELVFGGVDMSKFTGPLHGIEMASQYPQDIDGYYRYWINLTYVGVTQPGSCISVPVTEKGFEERVLPDTGTTLTYLPTRVYEGIRKFFPDAKDSSLYGTVIDCAHLTAEGTIDFEFGNKSTIRVPFKEFVFQLEPHVFGTNNETLCLLGVAPTYDEFYILGDTFMRSVYALFRQQQHKIYLGQYQDCGTNIISSHGIGEFHGDCGVDDSSVDPESSVTSTSTRTSSDPDAWTLGLTSARSSSTPRSCTSRSTGSFPTITTSSSTTSDEEEDPWSTIFSSDETSTDDFPTATDSETDEWHPTGTSALGWSVASSASSTPTDTTSDFGWDTSIPEPEGDRPETVSVDGGADDTATDIFWTDDEQASKPGTPWKTIAADRETVSTLDRRSSRSLRAAARTSAQAAQAKTPITVSAAPSQTIVVKVGSTTLTLVDGAVVTPDVRYGQ